MTKIALPHLPKSLTTIDDLSDRIAQDETLSRLTVHDADITHIRAKALAISESKLERVTAGGANLEHADFLDMEMNGCDWTAAKLPDASWRRVLVKGSRCGGMQLQKSVLRDVSFVNCLLNLANFRFAQLTYVRFTDCVLDEADFYMAKLHGVVFETCSLKRTEFSGSQLKRVDLRTSDAQNVLGVGSLAGAIIDSAQLTAMAPVLAQQLGIVVQDD